MNGMTLFDHRAAYPNSPGYKDNDTSREAAESMEKPAGKLRLEVLGMLHYHGPLTADECADKMKKDKLAVRPRFTELQQAGKIVDTGTRRKNMSGRSAKVWKLA